MSCLHCQSTRCFLAVLLWLASLLVHPAAQAASTYEVVAEPATKSSVVTGFTRARTELDLVSEVSAKCLKVHVDIGDPLPASGIFAELDATFTRLALEKNRVEQDKLRSSMVYLGKEVDRFRELVSRETAAQSTLDKLEQELDQARLALEGLKVAAADLKEQIARHTIRAPQGLIVVERLIEPGEWVAAGAIVGRVGDFGSLIVPVALSPEEFNWIKKQPSVPLLLPDFGSIQVASKVLRTSPAFDPETRKTNVELVISGHVPERRGGIRTELHIPVPDPSGSVILPRAALEERYEELWLTRPGGEQVKVVLLGAAGSDKVRVASPAIEPGDRFLVTTSNIR